MNERLLQIIQYKTNGRQKDFAELFGWTSPYMTKLVKGVNFGLSPILAILQRFPEINARWLITGEGNMFNNCKQDDLHLYTQKAINSIIEIEQYIPYMSTEEMQQYEKYVISIQIPIFNNETISRWKHKKEENDNIINQKFNSLNKK